MQPQPGAWHALLPTTGYRHGAKDCPRLPGQAPQLSSWHLGGGWMGRGGQLPLSSSQKSILMTEMATGSVGWPGLPEGHGAVPGSGSPSCEMKVETILQEIK